MGQPIPLLQENVKERYTWKYALFAQLQHEEHLRWRKSYACVEEDGITQPMKWLFKSRMTRIQLIRKHKILLLHCTHPGSRVYPSVWVPWLQCEDDQSPSTGIIIINAWNCFCAPPQCDIWVQGQCYFKQKHIWNNTVRKFVNLFGTRRKFNIVGCTNSKGRIRERRT
jgi:hypothetical protein